MGNRRSKRRFITHSTWSAWSSWLTSSPVLRSPAKSQKLTVSSRRLPTGTGHPGRHEYGSRSAPTFDTDPSNIGADDTTGEGSAAEPGDLPAPAGVGRGAVGGAAGD